MLNNKLINYLLENFDIDYLNDETENINKFVSSLDKETIIEFANVVLYLDNLPKQITDKIWSLV